MAGSIGVGVVILLRNYGGLKFIRRDPVVLQQSQLAFAQRASIALSSPFLEAFEVKAEMIARYRHTAPSYWLKADGAGFSNNSRAGAVHSPGRQI